MKKNCQTFKTDRCLWENFQISLHNYTLGNSKTVLSAYRRDAGVVGHHQAAHSVSRGQVWGPPGQGHLDAGRTPGNEVGKFALPDPLEAFMHLKKQCLFLVFVNATNDNIFCFQLSYLCGVNFSLDDVEDSNVAVTGLSLSSSGHHHILGLQQSPHHIQHCRLPHTSNLRRCFISVFDPNDSCSIISSSEISATYRLVSGQWCVTRHEEVETWSGNEWSDQTNQVIVHVARVAKRSCARRHDCRNLKCWDISMQSFDKKWIMNPKKNKTKTFSSQATYPARDSSKKAAIRFSVQLTNQTSLWILSECQVSFQAHRVSVGFLMIKNTLGEN